MASSDGLGYRYGLRIHSLGLRASELYIYDRADDLCDFEDLITNSMIDGERIRYLPSPVGACACATDAPSRWSRIKNVKACDCEASGPVGP